MEVVKLPSLEVFRVG